MNTYLTINLPTPFKIDTINNKKLEIDKIEIYEIVNNYFLKTITAICRDHPVRIILWEGASYDAIGEWTTDDVINKVLELYS